MEKLNSCTGICWWIRPQISEILKIVSDFTIFYLTLVILSVPWILMILWRVLVSINIRLFYKRRYALVPAADAFFFSNKLPNIMNVNLILFINDICDIEELRARILKNISTPDEDWNIPYKRFFYAVVEKFGFLCFEDKHKSFDINHHVRICPNVINPDKIHTESEMFSMIESTAFQEWDCTRPQWEMLLIERIKMAETGQICSAIAINFSHVYLDGISIVNFIRNCVLDQPSPKLNFDPVNPPRPQGRLINTMKTLNSLLQYIKLFFIGPHIFLKNYRCSKDQILCAERKPTFTSYKFLGRTKLHLNLETMKRVRKTFNCSTQAVFHSAFNGALRKIAKKKNNAIPPKILGAIGAVRLPYPNEYPHNRAILEADLMPIGIENPVARLREMNNTLKNLATPEILFSGAMSVVLIGLLPVKLIHAFLTKTFKFSYYISNVPGFIGTATVMGKEVPLYFGYAPIVNGFGTSVAITCNNGNFYAGIAVEKSELFKRREDMDQIIEEFENELKYYVTASSVGTKPLLKIE